MDEAAVPAAAPVPAAPAYAGFWIRVLATYLDSFLLGFPVLGLLYLGRFALHPQPLYLVPLYLYPAAYKIGFWRWKGATPGKLALGLRVVEAETGAPLGWGRAAARYFLMIVSALPLYLGYFWVGWDARKRGFHDHLGGTVVVREREPLAPVGAWIAATVLLYALITGGGIAFLIGWTVRNAARLKEDAPRLREEALRYAAGRAPEDCRDEAFRRLDACEDRYCESADHVFFSQCLRATRPGPAFCGSVPPKDEILRSALWTRSECARMGRKDSSCSRLLHNVPRICSEAPPAEPAALPAGAAAAPAP